jgi:anti-sigma B factor antagonist/stage II sporulation protein AA (anti-sigma F factor antagonist)
MAVATVKQHGGWSVVHVCGEVDIATAPELQAALTGLLRSETPAIAIDFAETAFLDSSGLAVCARVKKLADRYGGRIVLSGLTDMVRGVFQITGLDQLFEVCPSVEDLDPLPLPNLVAEA